MKVRDLTENSHLCIFNHVVRQVKRITLNIYYLYKQINIYIVHTSLSPQAIVEADLKPRQSPASIASFSSSSSSPPLSVGFLSLFTHSVWSLLCCRQLSGAIGNYPKGKVALPDDDSDMTRI